MARVRAGLGVFGTALGLTIRVLFIMKMAREVSVWVEWRRLILAAVRGWVLVALVATVGRVDETDNENATI
jgi:hypothetical protein